MISSRLLEGRRIGILCQYYPPEEGAAANRMDFFSYWLQKQGAELTILTAMPNYPKGIIHKGYRWRLWHREKGRYGSVLRAWCYASPMRSAARRLLNYSTFMLSSLRWLGELRRCDVIIFSSGPMFAGFAAFLANKLFGTRLVLDARDLWPDRIWDSGAANLPSSVEKLLNNYAQYMYRNVEAITCATQGVCDAISGRLDSPIPIFVVRNCDQTTGDDSLQILPTVKHPGENLRIIEAGTLGWAQDPETLCEAFKLLLEEGEEQVELAFAGSGPRVSQLEETLRAFSGQAEYVGHLTRDKLTQFLSSADIGVVTLTPTEHNLMTVSRRVYDYARAGLAIVYCGAGEGAELVKAAGAGIVVQPGNPQELADVIQSLNTDRDSLMNWKQKSRQLLKGEYAPEVIAGKLVDIVNHIK